MRKLIQTNKGNMHIEQRELKIVEISSYEGVDTWQQTDCYYQWQRWLSGQEDESIALYWHDTYNNRLRRARITPTHYDGLYSLYDVETGTGLLKLITPEMAKEMLNTYNGIIQPLITNTDEKYYPDNVKLYKPLERCGLVTIGTDENCIEPDLLFEHWINIAKETNE